MTLVTNVCEGGTHPSRPDLGDNVCEGGTHPSRPDLGDNVCEGGRTLKILNATNQ